MTSMKLSLLTFLTISLTAQALQKVNPLLSDESFQRYTQCRTLMQDPGYLMQATQTGDLRCLNTHMLTLIYAATPLDKASYRAATKIMLEAHETAHARDAELREIKKMVQTRVSRRKITAEIERVLKNS